MRALFFLAQVRRDTHAATDLGRRVEQRWPYYLMCRRAPDTRDPGLQPARRAEMGLLFVVQQRAADAEVRGGTGLKSNNPNTEGGE